jgi:hypothetical protein
MPFLISGSTTLAFAQYQDVIDADQRLFEANEGLTEDVVEQFTIRATERILTIIKDSDWWREYYLHRFPNPSLTTTADVPAVDIDLIIGRPNDFTDLCVYYSLWNYILPKIADFSKEDNAERAKIGYYQSKYNMLWDELINAGDWYDRSGDGTVTSTEKYPGNYGLKRVR